VLAEGTPDVLKDRVGGERLEIRLDDSANAEAAARALMSMSDDPPSATGDLLTVSVRRRGGAIVEAVRRLDDAKVGVEDIALRRPTLDDVFLALTGHAAESDDDDEVAA
jgi:ABC-2 type transport system ATP-binding protein